MRPQISLAGITLKRSTAERDAFRELYGVTATSADQVWNVTDNEVDFWLHGIVGDDYTQTDAGTFSKVLAQNKGKTLNLYVNSPGGLAYDGVAMFNAIQAHQGKTIGIIDGLAGSAASLAITACDTVKGYETSKFHPHYSLCVAMGHANDIRDTLLQMEKLDADLERIYAARTGLSISQVKTHLIGPHGDGTHFTATEAKSSGYIDDVIPMTTKRARNQTGEMVNYAERTKFSYVQALQRHYRSRD